MASPLPLNAKKNRESIGFVAQDLVKWVLNNGLPKRGQEAQYWHIAAQALGKPEGATSLLNIWLHNRMGVKDLLLEAMEASLFPELEEHCLSMSRLMSVDALFSKGGRNMKISQHTQTECANCQNKLSQTDNNGCVQDFPEEDDASQSLDEQNRTHQNHDTSRMENSFSNQEPEDAPTSRKRARKMETPSENELQAEDQEMDESNESQVICIKEEPFDDSDYSTCQVPSTSDSAALNQHDPAYSSSEPTTSWAMQGQIEPNCYFPDSDSHGEYHNPPPGGSSVDSYTGESWAGADMSMNVLLFPNPALTYGSSMSPHQQSHVHSSRGQIKDEAYLEKRIILHDGPFVTQRALLRKHGLKKTEASTVPDLMMKLQQKGLGRFIDGLNKSRVFFKILPHESVMSAAAVKHLASCSISMKAYRQGFGRMDQNLSMSSEEKFKGVYPFNTKDLHLHHFYPDPRCAQKYYLKMMNRASQSVEGHRDAVIHDETLQ